MFDITRQEAVSAFRRGGATAVVELTGRLFQREDRGKAAL